MNPLAEKAKTRIALNQSLLAIAIGIFFLTINLRQQLLFQTILTFQLVLSIPLFATSILAYSKIAYREETKRWDFLGWTTFIFGFAFILNVVGILLGNIVGIITAIIFFIGSWTLILIYSLVDISYNKSVILERITKDSLFILIQFLLGFLVVLGIL